MKNKRESGEVVIEASIVVTLVLIIITTMFYIGMVMYQQTAISVVANRTASNIALVYSNTLRDPFTGYIDPDNAYQQVTYGNMKTDAYVEAMKNKGTSYFHYRLGKSQMLPIVDRNVTVDVEKKSMEILKNQIVVTVTDTYNIPLLNFFGVDGGISFSGTGRADCVDYLEYLYGVEAVANPDKSPIPALPDSDTCIVTFVVDKLDGGFHAAVPVLRGKSIITSNPYSHSTMPKNPIMSGANFKGWVTEDGRKFSATSQVNEDMTIYGSWECIVKFDPTGGSVSPTQIAVPRGKTASLPYPSRHGYAFIGWYSGIDGNGKKYTSNVTEIFNHMTVYAHWQCLHLEFTAPQLIQEATCRTPQLFERRCTVCGYITHHTGAYGGHDYTARCGVIHDLG